MGGFRHFIESVSPIRAALWDPICQDNQWKGTRMQLHFVK